MRKGMKKFHPSMVRSKYKKHHHTSTKAVYDPFMQCLIYINKNGRVVRI